MRLLAFAAALSSLPLAARAQEKISLEEAVHRALARNASAVVAAQEIERAIGLMKEARAGSLPQLYLDGVYTRLDSDRTLQGRVIQPRDSLNLSAQLTVPLIVPQRWLAWEHASENVEVARASQADVDRSLAVTTARAYLSVMAQHRLVEISQQALDAAREHLAFAEGRLKIGSGSRLDQVRAGQEVSVDVGQLAGARLALTRSLEALGVLVGEDKPVDALDEVPLPAPVDEAAAEREAQEKRADVRAQDRRARLAERVLRDSYADYLPLLTGQFQPFLQTPATSTTPDNGWSAQLVLSIPLFDGGARYGLERERRASYNEAKVELEQVLRQTRSEVRTSFEAVQRADEQVKSAREAARLAHDALTLTTEAYKAGATNDLDVVDAQRQARTADQNALMAEDAARQARIDLLAASGRFP